MPRITVAVCTYNRYDVLPKAISSVAKQSLSSADFRIIVVDNSPDRKAAEEFGVRFRSISNLTYLVEQIPGLSNARNVAAREAETEFIAYMDDDAIAASNWLEEMLNAFDQFDSRAGIVGGRTDPLWECARPSWLHPKLLGMLSVVDWGGSLRQCGAGEWLAGTNVGYRTRLILEFGGFPIQLGRVGGGASLLSNEEISLNERITAAGHLTIYAPEARVKHLVEARRVTQQWFRKRSAWQAVSDYVMHPEKSVAEARHHWKYVLDYVNALPPRERTLRSLYRTTDDPELFYQQVNVIYMFTIASLTGYEFVDARPEA